MDSTGNLLLLLREGATLGATTVKSFTTLSAVHGSAGSARSFNSAGQVAARVLTADAGQQIVVMHVP